MTGIDTLDSIYWNNVVQYAKVIFSVALLTSRQVPIEYASHNYCSISGSKCDGWIYYFRQAYLACQRIEAYLELPDIPVRPPGSLK